VVTVGNEFFTANLTIHTFALAPPPSKV